MSDDFEYLLAALVICDPNNPADQISFSKWPNCSVADCEYKSNWPESPMCCAHQRGEAPEPFEVYMQRGVVR